MKSGKFSASSLAGTRTETSMVSVIARGASRVETTGRGPGDVLMSSHALAHASGKYSQLVAILGYGAAGNLDTALLQDVDDRLIGERMLGILVGDELLYLRLDATRRDVFAGGGGQAGGEEELERQHPARRLHELLVRHAAHRGFVHVDDLGHLTQGERLEVLH